MHVIDPRGPGLVPRAVTTLGLMDPNLERRDIVLHGDALDSELDEARSQGGLPGWLTLPVTCGELIPAPATMPPSWA